MAKSNGWKTFGIIMLSVLGLSAVVVGGFFIYDAITHKEGVVKIDIDKTIKTKEIRNVDIYKNDPTAELEADLLVKLEAVNSNMGKLEWYKVSDLKVPSQEGNEPETFNLIPSGVNKRVEGSAVIKYYFNYHDTDRPKN